VSQYYAQRCEPRPQRLFETLYFWQQQLLQRGIYVERIPSRLFAARGRVLKVAQQQPENVTSGRVAEGADSRSLRNQHRKAAVITP
jgi:hypothetical protein